jgi:sugar lactone lactonase YvrE
MPCPVRVRLSALLVACCLLASCSSFRAPASATPPVSREWPLEENGSRIVLVNTIQDFAAGSSRGFFQRALELVTGEQAAHPIVRPHGVLHDDAGRLFLADPGAGLVHRFDLPGMRYSTIDAGPDFRLASPIGVAADAAGYLYITDSSAGQVYRYDPKTETLRPFLIRPLSRPTGIAFNKVNGMLYVVDTLESQVVAVGLDGLERNRLKGGASWGSLNHPTDIAVDRVGQLIVNDSLNFRILVLTPEGELMRSFGEVGDAAGQFSRPKGIGIDSAGHIYVCDALRDVVQVFDSAGTPLLDFGRTGSEPGQFWMPSGIQVDRNDYIYVSDTFNRRIQIFRYVPAKDDPSGYSPGL